MRNRAFGINNKTSIILAVQKQPGSNTVAVADAVKALLPIMKQSMPAGVHIDRSFDASQNIRESIADVKFTLMLTILHWSLASSSSSCATFRRP